MPIVADNYEIVIGVDTHAAAHALCVVAAATGAAEGQSKFSGKPSGTRAGPHMDYRTEQGNKPPSSSSKASAPTEPGSPTACLRRDSRLPNLPRWHQGPARSR